MKNDTDITKPADEGDDSGRVSRSRDRSWDELNDDSARGIVFEIGDREGGKNRPTAVDDGDFVVLGEEPKPRYDTAFEEGVKPASEPEPEPELSEADREFTSETTELKEPSKFKQYIASVLSGSILTRTEVNKLFPYLLFIAFLMFLYISNNFQMQKMHRRESRLKTEITELRSKSVTLTSIRMNSTRQSMVMKELERRGIDLKEAVTPSKVIED